MSKMIFYRDFFNKILFVYSFVNELIISIRSRV